MQTEALGTVQPGGEEDFKFTTAGGKVALRVIGEGLTRYGGLVPWALIAGYGTRDQVGGTAFYTRADPSNFSLSSAGIAVGLFDRVELSIAEQRFGLGSTVPGRTIKQDVVGIKLKMAGDAVYDQDTLMPQIALGAQ